MKLLIFSRRLKRCCLNRQIYSSECERERKRKRERETPHDWDGLFETTEISLFLERFYKPFTRDKFQRLFHFRFCSATGWGSGKKKKLVCDLFFFAEGFGAWLVSSFKKPCQLWFRHTEGDIRRDPLTHPEPSCSLVGGLLNLDPLQRHIVDGSFLDFLPPVLHRALEQETGRMLEKASEERRDEDLG